MNGRVTVDDEFQRMWKEESIQIANRHNSFEKVSKFKYFGKTKQLRIACMKK